MSYSLIGKEHISEPTIIRLKHLAEKIVIVDGQPGCGKTMFSTIISAMDRVEMLTYAFEIEFVCRLFHLKKMKKDAAIAMVRMFTDHKLYQMMMSRETNFRYSDLSSVFKAADPWRYLKRIFQEGDMVIPERIKNQNPILSLTTHDLLSVSKPVFEGLENRVVFIEIVRHPLYMLIQQTLNYERLLSDPRDVQINIKHGDDELPYYAYQWEKLFISCNAVERAIYTMDNTIRLTNKTKMEMRKNFKNNIITIPFEKFVLDPLTFMKKIELLLETNITSLTKKIMKKQKVPRKKISDGIPLDIYKRCGWEPPEKLLSEKQELAKRRKFAVDNGASKQSLEVLDRLGEDYENIFSVF